MDRHHLGTLSGSQGRGIATRALGAVLLTAVAPPALTPAVADECPWRDEGPADTVLDQPRDCSDEPGDADTTCSACRVAADADGDEALYGADLANPDSDFDGVDDGDEVDVYGT